MRTLPPSSPLAPIALPRKVLSTILVSLWITACTEEKDPPPLSLDDTGVDCSAHAPVVSNVTAGNGGLQHFESADYYTFAIGATVTDADLDLDRMTTDVWWDLIIDGAVDMSGAPGADGNLTVTRDLPCGVASATFTHLVPMKSDGELPFNTQVEVAVVGVDSHLVSSETPGLAVGWTPKEDGTDGGI